MHTVKRTILETLVLAAVGIALGATANAVRAKGSLSWTKAYFRTSMAARRPVKVSDQAVAKDDQPKSETEVEAAAYPEHDYQTVSFEDVKLLFESGDFASGAVALVDARDDENYLDGHIPGAIQADHYQLDAYIDKVLAAIEGAEKVVVYCNGGDCEDSIFLCRDLIDDFDVPYEKVFLYAGGWQEWSANDMPVATGRDDEAGEP